MKNQTKVERKSDRELVMTRTFDAPARLVFEAWTNLDLFIKWWVPRSIGMKVVSTEADIRTGGSYRFVFQMGDHPPMAFFGKYVEVTPHSKIQWTNEESPDGPLSTVTLEERGGKTFLVLHELHPSKEALDVARESGASEGTVESFEQLDEMLAK